MTGNAIEVPEPERLPLSEINFANYNPRFISDEEMESLKASLDEHGIVLNLVVQREADDGTPFVLIGGHQRVRAARALCSERGVEPPEHVWSTVLDVDDATAKRLNIALNKISGEFDPFRLGELFATMPELSPEAVKATGFSQEQIDALVSDIQLPEDEAAALEASVGSLPTFNRPRTRISVDFGSEEKRDRARELLDGIEARDGGDYGSILLGLLEGHEQDGGT